MTSGYDSRGRRVGATVLELGPNFITQIKTQDGKDGYQALQLGFSSKKSVKRPQLGHLKKAGVDQQVRWMREVKADSVEDVNPGQQITVGQIFAKGDVVKVTGVSKGRGFQGGVKRYNFSGGPKTHGQSDRHRAPGSIGAGTTPGRVYKGKRMAGHMGVEGVSYKNLEVLEVDPQNNLVTIKGAVPGAPGSLVVVERLGKVKGYTPPPEPEEEEVSKEEKVSEETKESNESEEPKAEGSIDTSAQQEQIVQEGAENAG